ncbi:hypothetical protein Ple7327_4287 [Pleurocapsa sp. PCC 7327]|nr:hypothetical protein Ple7327_4287 [Pleurocapsa sp. PCC 7327]
MGNGLGRFCNLSLEDIPKVHFVIPSAVEPDEESLFGVGILIPFLRKNALLRELIRKIA